MADGSQGTTFIIEFFSTCPCCKAMWGEVSFAGFDNLVTCHCGGSTISFQGEIKLIGMQAAPMSPLALAVAENT